MLGPTKRGLLAITGAIVSAALSEENAGESACPVTQHLSTRDPKTHNVQTSSRFLL